MAQLIDFGGQVNSNLVQGIGTNSVTFTMPGNFGISVESVLATINNAAGAATRATLVIRDQSGEVIATKRQVESIPAAGSGTATWALRTGDDSALGRAQHAGYYWFNNTAAAAQVQPSGGTVYFAAWDRIQLQWGDPLLTITNQALPKVTQAGLYSFSYEVRLITGNSVMGAYAGKTVAVYQAFNNVPAPLFGNADVTFPMTIMRDGTYPSSSSAFVCTMRANDSFNGGFYTDQPTLGANYRGFGDCSLVITRLDVVDLTA